jgi:hypothetical protein
MNFCSQTTRISKEEWDLMLKHSTQTTQCDSKWSRLTREGITLGDVPHKSQFLIAIMNLRVIFIGRLPSVIGSRLMVFPMRILQELLHLARNTLYIGFHCY